MEIIYIILGVIIGALIGWLLAKVLAKSLEKELIALNATYNATKDELTKIEESRNREREKMFMLQAQLESVKASKQHQETRVKELETIREKFMSEFENISAKIIKQNTEHLTSVNNQKLRDTLSPLGDQIKKFEEKIERSDASRNQLKGELNKLFDLNQKMSEDAKNLTKALKGDNKIQGSWGEFILERVLESSGLVKDREYHTQVNSKSLDGKSLRPDVIINLPDSRHLIIDSKVSLVGYEKYIASINEIEKISYKKALIISLRAHIKSLSQKNYQAIPGINTPDFVLLFMPIESAFSLALETDQDIYAYAWQQKIVLVSPTTLLATLRTVASIWKQEKQTQNAVKIAQESGKLYDKFVGFVTDMENIGKHIDHTQKAYDGAMNKLSEGKGNLVRRAEELRKMGANTSKLLDQNLDSETE